MITLDLQMDGKSLSLSLRQGEHPRTVADEFCTTYKVTTPDCGGVISGALVQRLQEKLKQSTSKQQATQSTLDTIGQKDLLAREKGKARAEANARAERDLAEQRFTQLQNDAEWQKRNGDIALSLDVNFDGAMHTFVLRGEQAPIAAVQAFCVAHTRSVKFFDDCQKVLLPRADAADRDFRKRENARQLDAHREQKRALQEGRRETCAVERREVFERKQRKAALAASLKLHLARQAEQGGQGEQGAAGAAGAGSGTGSGTGGDGGDAAEAAAAALAAGTLAAEGGGGDGGGGGGGGGDEVLIRFPVDIDRAPVEFVMYDNGESTR
jgi:hypothetical protein